MSIVNITSFRKNIFGYLDNVVSSNDVITVTTKEGNAVIVSEEEYQGLLETAYLNGIPNIAESIVDGIKTPTSELVEIDWKNEL